MKAGSELAQNVLTPPSFLFRFSSLYKRTTLQLDNSFIVCSNGVFFIA